MSDVLARLRKALAGRYLIENEAGRGGMATVYRARDLKHGRFVAIKVLHPELATSVGSERFLHEIQTAAQLNHPHILALYDSGEADGLLYYIMPYVEGESLRNRLEREGCLAISDTVRIACQVAEALAYAHARGIIHRDIKPENILLVNPTHTCVADFGLARALHSVSNRRLTATGLLVGSPLYMSPEQCGGEEWLDGRTDVYGLGCVLWEMLAGRPPFEGSTVQAVIAQHMTKSPLPLRALRPDVPATVEAVVMRAMEKNAGERLDAAEMLEMLNAASRRVDEPISARAAERLRLEPPLTVVPASATTRYVPEAEGTSLWEQVPPGAAPTAQALAPASDSLALSGERPNNLPLSPNAFVGRDRQLREVRDLLLLPDTRLLTLTGTGGTGKTRLGLEVAASLVAHFSDGVFVVHLAPVSDPNLLASTIMQALEIPEFATKTPLETLKHYLAHRDLLLVLDNFEQIVDASRLLLELLRDCSRLKILVTSREGLNVRLERQYLVPPLKVPHCADRQDVESLAAIDSVRLFVERVQEFDRDFTLNAENADAVCSICALLDGLPLALELAARQLKLYTPQSLLKDLQTSLDVLGEGPRDLPRHQRTLNDTIGWSYHLLNADEQSLFCRLSVFRGGATIDAAAAIGADGRPRAEVVRTLLSLVNKGLVHHDSTRGDTRVSMLEMIREFASRRLAETAVHGQVQERHTAYFRALAEKLAPGLVGRDQRAFVTPLLAEEDNFRTALASAIERADAGTTSALLCSLLWMWIPRGQFTEGRAWARRAIDAFGGYAPCRELGLIFESAGWLQVLGGDYEGALPHFEQAYAMFHALPDAKDRVRSTITLGVTCLVLGDARGSDLTDQALALCPSLGDQYLVGLARVAEGVRHEFSGNAPDSSAAYHTALLAFSECDHIYWRGQMLQNLARLSLQDGDWRRAGDLAAQALELGRDYHYPMITNIALAAMGAVSVVKGSPADAARIFGAVEASLAELGVSFEPPEQIAMMEYMQITETLLGAEAFAVAFREGKRWGGDELDAAVVALRSDLAG